MKKYNYDTKWPWDIYFLCDRSNTSLLLTNCTARYKAKGSHCPHPCKERQQAVKQRLKDMTMKDHNGIMFGCLTCRYCIYFHKGQRKILNGGRFVCPKYKKVFTGSSEKWTTSKTDTFHCKQFVLKKFISCPARNNELIMCNDCLWDYHTQKDYCKNCQVFSCSTNSKLKIKPKQKLKLKKKPKLKLKKKPVLKLRR